MSDYEVTLTKLHKNKWVITVRIEPNVTKEFDIHVTDKGLRITGDCSLKVTPMASNQVIIDEDIR